jgi:hypothetical protein
VHVTYLKTNFGVGPNGPRVGPGSITHFGPCRRLNLYNFLPLSPNILTLSEDYSLHVSCEVHFILEVTSMNVFSLTIVEIKGKNTELNSGIDFQYIYIYMYIYIYIYVTVT